jgi:hypothetical protein
MILKVCDIGDEGKTYIYLSKKAVCLFCHVEISQTTTLFAMPLAPWESLGQIQAH